MAEQMYDHTEGPYAHMLRNLSVPIVWLSKALSWLMLIPIYIYRLAISPFTPPSCRFTPTCSAYAVEAIKRHGPVLGLYLALKRILRCHPWGGSGYDPVPEKFRW